MHVYFAKYCVAWCFENGQGVERNHKLAYYWYMKSAKEGYNSSQSNIAYCYGIGQGILQDEKKAFKWYQEAGKNGNILSQRVTGIRYMYGTGVKKDVIKAIQWLTKAADSGDSGAEDELDDFERTIFCKNHYLNKYTYTKMPISPLPTETVLIGINFQEAIFDTPSFRANVRKFEEQIDHFEKWLEGILKALRLYIEESIKFNEACNSLAKRALPLANEDSLLDRDFTLSTIRIFTDAFQTTSAFKEKLVSDMDEKFIQPILSFTKTDLKELKEVRRAFDRALEKYDNMLSKYTSQSKTKEASALREFLGGSYAQLDLHVASTTIYKGFENQMDRLKNLLSESRKTCEYQTPCLIDLRRKLEEGAINMNKPQRKLTKYTDNPLNTVNIHPVTESNLQLPSPTGKHEKQGYLFMKSLNGKSTWSRKYFYLKDGSFWWVSIGHGKLRSNIEQSEKINVLLCEMRIDFSQDRRFCFEIVSWILQAETEEDLKSWSAIFESAKRYAFRMSNDLSSSGTTDNNTIQIKGDDSHTSKSGVENTQNDSEKSSIPSNQQNFWGSIQWGIMPAMNLLMNSVNVSEGDEDSEKSTGTKKKRNRPLSGSIPVGSGVDGSIAEYPQTLMSHNLQLHLLFENMSEKEFVLDVYQCAWQKDNMLFKGRAYFTQDKFYFYSEIMSVINMFYISWKEIKTISYKKTGIQQTVEFFDENENQKYIIKTFLDNDKVFNDKAQLIWKLVTIEKITSLQSIFDAVWKSISTSRFDNFSHEKLDENKKIEGSYNDSTNNVNNANNVISLDKDVNQNEEHENKENKENKGNRENKGNKENKLETSKNNDERNNNYNGIYDKSNGIYEKNNESSHNVDNRQKDDEFPSNLVLPKGPVTCGCSDHLDKLETEVEYPVSAKKLYRMLFDTKSTLWERMHQKQGNTLTNCGPWLMNGSERKRELKFIMPINNPMSKVKETDCIQTQTCLKYEDHLRYVVLIQTKALQIPYNDSFLPMSKWCITYKTPNSCKITCHIGIKWFKSPMVKALIKSAAMTGLSETATEIITILNADIAQGKSRMPSNSPIRTVHVNSLKRRMYRHKNRTHTTIKHPASSEESISLSTGSAGSINRMTRSNSLNSVNIVNINNKLSDGNKFFEIISSNTKLIKLMLIILTLSMLYNIYLWVYLSENMSKSPTTNGTHFQTPLAPSVYLRDLEEQILNINTRIQNPPYPWLLHSHRRLSNEISYARKRMAVLRYDLLLAFKLINSIDKKLIKNEYINWLLDERAKYEGSEEKTSEYMKKYKIELKNIIRYCGNIKEQLDIFAATF
ncbi:7259_t:CDS:10 [Diversispora eburnea]|uniref:7259_t:CDS:1 n=1 Tax=Diversispora eburnea TaxID=1213867 RepID=A0A9N8V532_9GLOM|nr:7259_t:CDS:10 [Diversispora eburnea]